jgi:hypothetical protein
MLHDIPEFAQWNDKEVRTFAEVPKLNWADLPEVDLSDLTLDVTKLRKNWVKKLKKNPWKIGYKKLVLIWKSTGRKAGLVEELSTWNSVCRHELVEEIWTRWRNSVCSGLNLLKWFVNWCAENFQKTTVLNCCKWPNCAPNGHNWRGVSDKRRTNCNDLFWIQAPTLLAKTEKFAGASCGSMLGGGPENLNWWRGNCALTEPEEAKYWTGCNTPRIAWMYGI